MFVLTLREMMVQKGLKPRVLELVKRGIGRHAAKHYLSGRAKGIKLDDLYTLCLTFNCTPKELLLVQFDDPKVYEKHPLFDWSHPLTAFPLEDLMTLTPAQMAKAQQALKEIISEGK